MESQNLKIGDKYDGPVLMGPQITERPSKCKSRKLWLIFIESSSSSSSLHSQLHDIQDHQYHRHHHDEHQNANCTSRGEALLNDSYRPPLAVYYVPRFSLQEEYDIHFSI